MPVQKPKVNAVEQDTNEPDSDLHKPIISISKRCSTIIASNGGLAKKRLLTHEIEINNVKLLALIDTGSETSLINAETASLNSLVPKGPALSLTGADSSPITCHGHVSANLTITVDQITKTAESARFVVAENLCAEVILGLDMLGWLRILVDAETSCIIFKPEPKNLDIRTQETIPARSQMVVSAVVPHDLSGTIQTIPFNTGDIGIMVANSIDEIHNNQVHCLVTNLDVKAKTLKIGQTLASYEILTAGNNLTVNTTMQVGDTPSYVTVGNNLTESQRNQLRELISKHKEAFSTLGELGCTTALEHDIELTDGAKPFAEPLRRRPIAHQEETRRQIKGMLEQGVIEESKSPWAAAYVLAKKKSGELRLCVDFRKLNDMTKKCVYPLPNIEDCIETLAGKRFFSQLDMASGFWQLPLTDR